MKLLFDRAIIYKNSALGDKNIDILSIPEIFQNTVSKYADNIAIDFMSNKTDFRTVDYLSNNIASSLAASGIVKGDRVALYCINSDAFAIIYLGIVKAGATVVPVNLMLTPTEITYLLNDSGAKGLFYHELFDKSVAAFRNNTPELSCIIRIGTSEAVNSEPLSDKNYKDLVQKPGEAPTIDIDPLNDLAATLQAQQVNPKVRC